MGQVVDYLFSDKAQLVHIGWHIVLAFLIYLAAWIGIRVASRMIRQVLAVRKSVDDRRRKTLESLLTNVVKYTIYFILIMTILPLFGVKIAALLAGAGVAGLAISFGAQNLIQDFFTGFFILLEDQYGIGDWVEINGITGSVTIVGARITAIQEWTGQTVYIRNGTISQVINISKAPSLAVISFNVSYSTAAEEALETLQEVLEEVVREDGNALGDIQVLGVNALNQSDYTIEATVSCKPYGEFSVQRLAYKKLQERFATGALKPPFQNIVWINGAQTEVQDEVRAGSVRGTE
ncbi:mechanosensitive ion channel family protein [Alicyclobacillus sp. ALC3]|uniref:mechanosensitive ion channel family protein n=1 Tax=Alicyclobacillus sp. ALC3 TaxID=2796143 RepID=UPI002378B625|nr:mechanosensitive ion channel family protein [Alicyclobacillus sp. ALC3]WDL97661.1 mechanosensitive ion channel family protein [Alicyclobacillus sp. ALC3]